MRPELAAALLLAAVFSAHAQTRELIPGPGSTLTRQRCTPCHDGEHIARSKLTRAEWEDNLQNMRRRGMPPLAEDEVRVILEYLVTYYGPDPPPAPSPDTLAAGGDDPVQKLLNASGCTACHAIDESVIGPSFREIGRKYAADREAAAKLARKITGGGAGVWGPTPMPPYAGLAEADLRQLVDWVLRQR